MEIQDTVTRSKKRRTHAAVLLLAAFVPSCSMKISHPDGSVTYLGSVNIQEGNLADAPLVHSRRIGLMFDTGVQTNGFAVGYDDRLLVKPQNDKITRIDYSPGSHRLNFESQ